MGKKIVVLGGGYAGVLSAKKIAKRLKNLKDFEITIIDKKPFHTMLTELHEVAAWRVEESSIRMDLNRIFAGRNVKVVMDTVISADYDRRVLSGQNGEYAYDYLVLASGSKPAFFNVPGADTNAFAMWSYDDAVRIRDHIMDMFRKAAAEPDEDEKRKLLTFFIVGAGFTGVELAGELAELVRILCGNFEIDPSFVSLYDVDVLDRICVVLPEKLSAKAQRRLKKKGVKVMLKTNVVSVGEDSIELNTGSETVSVKTGTVIWTAGIEGSDIAQSSGELGLKGRGRVQTDEYLRSLTHPEVYVGGDNTFYIPEGEKCSVPQMVEHCEQGSDIIANNLVCEAAGIGQLEKYKPSFHGVMVSVGGRYGVANVGMGKAMFVLPYFFAMLSKHFINIMYFIQVLGWNKVFSYINHEFFTIRNCRSFLGGHFSNRSATFFLVPLRVFLGGFWIYEGVSKVTENWLKSPNLTNFFNGANSMYNSILGTASSAAASGAADAASSATAAANSAIDAASSATATAGATVASVVGHALINWNFGLFKVILVQSSDFAFKLQVGLVDWMINTLVIPHDPVQMVFQIVIVLAEILVGLALIGGLFTTPAAVASIALQMMFLTSTGLYMSTWWMIFASIAMLFGAGRVFSLDYYVMPWLKRQWKKVRFVRKWYLYHD